MLMPDYYLNCVMNASFQINYHTTFTINPTTDISDLKYTELQAKPQKMYIVQVNS